MQALRALVEAQPDARIAVFTHGGVLDMLWREVHGLPLAGPRECAIPNTGINRLHWDGRRLEILQWADAAHVPV
jgi:2,3-bisphosphoglycerate-dependent phosphoglycerate mutase